MIEILTLITHNDTNLQYITCIYMWFEPQLDV